MPINMCTASGEIFHAYIVLVVDALRTLYACESRRMLQLTAPSITRPQCAAMCVHPAKQLSSPRFQRGQTEAFRCMHLKLVFYAHLRSKQGSCFRKAYIGPPAPVLGVLCGLVSISDHVSSQCEQFFFVSVLLNINREAVQPLFILFFYSNRSVEPIGCEVAPPR